MKKAYYITGVEVIRKYAKKPCFPQEDLQAVVDYADWRYLTNRKKKGSSK